MVVALIEVVRLAGPATRLCVIFEKIISVSTLQEVQQYDAPRIPHAPVIRFPVSRSWDLGLGTWGVQFNQVVSNPRAPLQLPIAELPTPFIIEYHLTLLHLHSLPVPRPRQTRRSTQRSERGCARRQRVQHSSYPPPCAMSHIESSIQGDDRLHHAPRGDPAARVTVVISNGGGSQQLASAAELASIESEKTREKLKTKAYHVRYV